jgi:hypothetical protein
MAPGAGLRSFVLGEQQARPGRDRQRVLLRAVSRQLILDRAGAGWAGGGPAGSHVLVGRGGSIAKVSDLLELQAQSLERSTSTYAAFVRDAAAQARAATLPNLQFSRPDVGQAALRAGL